eukprot:Em0016g986a
MGCAECKLIQRLCKEGCIEELVGVDVDEGLLKERQHLIEPLTTDYLYPRPNPLNVKLMRGSIAQPDIRLYDFDLFTCIEVIEHLEGAILERVPSAVFGALRPQVVLITTPNVEFNVLFPGCAGYRHYDHKFEWTRREFQEWCTGVCVRYQYSVEFSGIGTPPAGSECLGHCSQVAKFTRCSSTESDPTLSRTVGNSYTLVVEANHPFRHAVAPTEKLSNEAQYYLRVLTKLKLKDERDDDGSAAVLIPLVELLTYRKVSEMCSSVAELREALSHSGNVQLDPSGEYAVIPRQAELSDNDSPSDACDGEENFWVQSAGMDCLEPEPDW